MRNPNWNPHTDYRPAYLNQIDINIGGEPPVIGQQVLKGEDVVQNDSPAQSIVQEAYEHYPQQITFTPGSGTYYASLNNAHGPFTNIDLRKAVWAALDRDAIVKVARRAARRAADDPLPLPRRRRLRRCGRGHGAEGRLQRTPRRRHGSRDEVHEARRLSRAASYTGARTLQVVGSTGEPEEGMAQIVNQTLQNLGFKTHLSLVDQSVMYDKYCTVPAQEIDVCPNAGWVRDFADPQTVLYVPFYGPAIEPQGNSNWSQVNDPKINAAMQQAELVVGEPARAKAWAKIDEMLVEKAVAAPEVYVNQANIEGCGVDGVNQLWNSGAWDYDFTSLK